MKKWVLVRCSLQTAGMVGKTFQVLCSDTVDGILGWTDGWTHMHVRLGTEFSTLNLCWQEEYNICFVVVFIFVFSCLILVVEPNQILEKYNLFKQNVWWKSMFI